MGNGANRRDVKKEQFWRSTIREAARSGMSTREFCSRRRLKEGQFYWWQRKVRKHPGASRASNVGKEASFALVSEEPGESLQASIELVLKNGCRLRIGKGVDEDTLRTALEAMGQEEC